MAELDDIHTAIDERQLFSFGFNSGILVITQLLKELHGLKLEAAILTAERVASEKVEELTDLPIEDTLLKLAPVITEIKRFIDSIE